MNDSVLSNLVITKVHSVSTLYSPENKRTKRTDRRCWAIVLKYEGETVYTESGKQTVSDISHVTVLPKGCSYEWECTRSGHFIILEFECETTYPGLFSFPIKHGEKLLKMLKELEYKRNLRGEMIEIESLRDTYSILLSIILSSCDRYLPESKQQRLQEELDYISKRYREPITNEMLAETSGMSSVYFRKLFKQVMGISPIAYVKQVRIEKAKEMLRSDYGTLTDLATMLGYASLYDFSRDFKKQTGIPPSKYK